jgi:hypothetical protein
MKFNLMVERMIKNEIDWSAGDLRISKMGIAWLLL